MENLKLECKDLSEKLVNIISKAHGKSLKRNWPSLLQVIINKIIIKTTCPFAL